MSVTEFGVSNKLPAVERGTVSLAVVVSVTTVEEGERERLRLALLELALLVVPRFARVR